MVVVVVAAQLVSKKKRHFHSLLAEDMPLGKIEPWVEHYYSFTFYEIV